MSLNESVFLSLSTSLVSILSVIACIYVCLNIYLGGYRPFKCKKLKSKNINNIESNNVMMIDVIFWMCITDGLHQLQMSLTWTPQIFVNYQDWFYDNNGKMCEILGVFANYFSIQSPLWHMLLAYHLFYLLKGYSIQSLNNQKKYHYIIVTTVN